MGNRKQEVFVQSLMELYERENFYILKIATFDRMRMQMLRQVGSDDFNKVEFTRVSLTLLDYMEKQSYNHAEIINRVTNYFGTLEVENV